MVKRIIDAPTIYPMTWQYSPAIEVSGGRTVYMSGIIGARPDGTIPHDIVEQAELLFSNLAELMRAAGGTIADIVKLNIYVGEDYPSRAAEIRAIRSRYFTSDYPCSTLVQVAGFASPDYRIEVEAVAAMPAAPDAV